MRLQLAAAAIDFVVMGVLVTAMAVVTGFMAKRLLSPLSDGFFLPRDEIMLVVLVLTSLIAVVPTANVDVAAVRRGASLGHRLTGVRIQRHANGRRLSLSQARARWVLLYAPLALTLGYPLVSGAVWDPGPFLILIHTPWTPYVAAPALVWYAVLALSALVSTRPLHDRIVGSVVVR